MKRLKGLHKLFTSKKPKNATYVLILVTVIVVVAFASMQNFGSVSDNQTQNQEKPQEVAAVVSFVTGTFSVSGDKYVVTDETGAKTEMMVDPELTMLVGSNSVQTFVGKKVDVAVSKNQKTGSVEAVSIQFSE